jgi:hypothetical protein
MKNNWNPIVGDEIQDLDSVLELESIRNASRLMELLIEDEAIPVQTKGNFMWGFLACDNTILRDYKVSSCNASTNANIPDDFIKCKDLVVNNYADFLISLHCKGLPTEIKYCERLTEAIKKLEKAQSDGKLDGEGKISAYCDDSNPKLKLRDTETEFLYQLWQEMRNGLNLDHLKKKEYIIILTHLPVCDGCYWHLFLMLASNILKLFPKRLGIIANSAKFNCNTKAHVRNNLFTTWSSYDGIGWRILDEDLASTLGPKGV